MWLDSMLLILTLAVALIGTTTKASETVAGKTILSGLLVISTGLSLWLKRQEAKRSEALQRGIKGLVTASLPTDEFIKSVENIMTEVRVEEGYRLLDTSHVIRYERAVYLCRLFWSDEGRSIDSLAGLVVLDDRDLGELALLDERHLRKTIREFIVGKWQRDDLRAHQDRITSRVFTTIVGWIEFSEANLPNLQTVVSHDAREAIEAMSVKVVDDRGDEIDAPILTISGNDVEAMFGFPALERGVRIARKTDAWLHDLAQHLGRHDEPEDKSEDR
jgi:hypothetical protein